MPGVLARDQVHGPQRLEAPRGHILQVADRRRDEIESSGHSKYNSVHLRATQNKRPASVDAGQRRSECSSVLERPPARKAVPVTVVVPPAVPVRSAVIVSVTERILNYAQVVLNTIPIVLQIPVDAVSA